MSNYTSNYQPKQPSEKQQSVYLDMCKNRRITPKDINTFTARTLYQEIERIKELPFYCTDAQKKTILDLMHQINELGGKWTIPSDIMFHKMPSDKASALIEKLSIERRELNEVAPATDEQAKTIAEWRACPSIPWEDYKLSNRVYLTHLTSWSTDHNLPQELEKRAFRMRTIAEFVELVKKTLTQREANAFIYKWRSHYYEWRQTRITKGMANELRKLEYTLSVFETSKEIVRAVNEDGEIIEIETSTSRERRNQYLPYEPLSDDDLRQLSKEQASTLISQLQKEIRDRKLTRFGASVHGNDQQLLQEKIQQFADHHGTGVAKTEQEAFVVEQRKMMDTVHRLATVVGYRDDQLLENIKLYRMDNDLMSKARKDGFKAILSPQLQDEFKSYMYQALDYSSPERLSDSLARLYAFTEEVEGLTDIVNVISIELKGQSEDGEVELQQVI